MTILQAPTPAPSGIAAIPAGPVIIVLVIAVVVVLIVYYNRKAAEVKQFDATDYCHVKYNSVSDSHFTVTCEGKPCVSGSCQLYSRRKGTEAKWQPTQKDMPEDANLEYRCFCHDPNRKSGGF